MGHGDIRRQIACQQVANDGKNKQRHVGITCGRQDIFYGVNWFNIATVSPLLSTSCLLASLQKSPGFNIATVSPLLSTELGQDVSLLGTTSTAFLVGVGIFQILSGVFSAKYGLRTTTILEIAVSSSATLATGLVSEASQLIWLRFIVGLGTAFFFSSGVVLIASYSSARKAAGFSIGMMNSAHSVGGIIGTFAWIIVAAATG